MNLIDIVVALLLAFAGIVILAPIYIGLLQRLGYGKVIRADGPEAHYGKAGTPTMGGMLVVVVVLFLAMALRLEDAATLTPMLTLVGVGILGAIDDFVNVRSGIGMRGRWKLVWQTVVAILAAVYIWSHFNLQALNIPLVGQIEVAPVIIVSFIAFVIVGTSNAVNLTDGLDGLAGGVLIFSFVAYLLISLVPVPGIKEAQPELAVFCALVIGALMGFLWFNVHPAQIFMGDSGALALGATLAVVATVNGQLPLLLIVGHRLLRRDHERGDPGAQLPLPRTARVPHDAAAPSLRAASAGPRRRSPCASGSSRRSRGCSASASSSPATGSSRWTDDDRRPPRRSGPSTTCAGSASSCSAWPDPALPPAASWPMPARSSPPTTDVPPPSSARRSRPSAPARCASRSASTRSRPPQ